MADPFAEFIGIPFVNRGLTLAGADCWGLFRLALQKVAGLELPAYDDQQVSLAERRIKAEMIRGSMGDWHEIAAGSERRFDGILMRDGRFDSHIGLVVQPGRMLHTYQGSASCVDRYQSSPFRERIVGFWRHRAFDLGTE
jgi:cell wall-associated NlpC family hydrolase